jgi:signal transduction histidine kinase
MMLRLMVVAGPDAGRVLETDEETVSLGRASGNTMVFTDPRVSARHGEIVRVGEVYRYEDLGSRNGSQVLSPGHPAAQRVSGGIVSLSDGDALALGPGTLVAVRTSMKANAEVSVVGPAMDALVERLERDPVRLFALARFQNEIAGRTSLQELSAALVEGFARAFPSATRVVLLWTTEPGAGAKAAMAFDRTRGAQQPERAQVSASMVGEARETRTARLYRESFRDLPLPSEALPLPQFATMTAPLVADDVEWGAVQIDQRAVTTSPFAAEDLDLFALLCHRAAIAVRAERRREDRVQTREAQLARAIDRDVRDWTVLVSGLTDELAGGVRRLLTTLDSTADASLKARIAGEREFITDCLETLRSNVTIAREVAFPVSQHLLGRVLELEMEPIDPMVLLRQVARSLRPISRREISVTEAILPPILADRARLFRALLNLMENAVEAVREGGSEGPVRLHAGLAQDASFPGGRCMAISITDTGNGIGSDVLRRIDAGESITTQPDGTGVGILIAREIVEAHGGSLVVESEEGRGTTATLKLRLA